ncbi:hypothetical protein BOH78_3925 [Pichia kudriavzevii]|uniref:Uncharacterized protein n=1 Tax=Pichia kudriavzevii TaxID=4909 RepID=A0A099NTI7_PICKU|nr:hypothetical protein JL09_g5659 [Pichia kudriavzevii]ONH72203.1 hypothetical protein BOH78_3925 [Pichia kudriavzevii]
MSVLSKVPMLHSPMLEIFVHGNGLLVYAFSSSSVVFSNDTQSDVKGN